VQAFHRIDGKEVYPASGLVNKSQEIGVVNELDVTVIDRGLKLVLNGQDLLDYLLPVERNPGRLALWVHQGAAEFLDVTVYSHEHSVRTFEEVLKSQQRLYESAKQHVGILELEAGSLEARVAAELAAWSAPRSTSAVGLAKIASDADALAVHARRPESPMGVFPPDLGPNADREATPPGFARNTPYTPLGPQYPRHSTGRRLALARWMTSDSNPRTARVAVNHIWARHFGRPLVGTPENFGLNGQRPTHPELLDWLASELIDSGWKMKSLHRRIVLSSTYRMATSFPAETGNDAFQRDPENRLYWRMNSRRMEAELVRDSTLYLAGKLDLTIGGPEIPEHFAESQPRRSLYFRTTPNESAAILAAFDMANPNACYRRHESIVPGQSLVMMNSGLVQDASRQIAARLANEPDFVVAAFEMILGRSPSEDELQVCRQFVTEHAETLAQPSREAFAAGGTAQLAPATDPTANARENLIQVLLLHNDFVTVR
jgi:hypothetical protein